MKLESDKHEWSGSAVLEPYQHQLIEKRFFSLLAPLSETPERESMILRIHKYMKEGFTEEKIIGLFTGYGFPLPHAVTFASGKGGVGKSMLSVNTAVFLANSGKKVLLFDADYGLSNAHIYLNFRARKSLLDYFLSGNTEDAVESVRPNLDYIHTGSGELKLADIDEHEFTRIRRMLLALAGRYDAIIMDCSPGIGKGVMQTLLMGSQAVLVSTPHVSSVTDTYALIKVLCQASVRPRISVALNMAKSVYEADEAFARIAQCAKKFLGETIDCLGNVLYSMRVSESLNRKMPVVEACPDDIRSTRRISAMAQLLSGRMRKAAEGGASRAQALE